MCDNQPLDLVEVYRFLDNRGGLFLNSALHLSSVSVMGVKFFCNRLRRLVRFGRQQLDDFACRVHPPRCVDARPQHERECVSNDQLIGPAVRNIAEGANARSLTLVNFIHTELRENAVFPGQRCNVYDRTERDKIELRLQKRIEISAAHETMSEFER